MMRSINLYFTYLLTYLLTYGVANTLELVGGRIATLLSLPRIRSVCFAATFSPSKILAPAAFVYGVSGGHNCVTLTDPKVGPTFHKPKCRGTS